jgi:hypothetical protein
MKHPKSLRQWCVCNRDFDIHGEPIESHWEFEGMGRQFIPRGHCVCNMCWRPIRPKGKQLYNYGILISGEVKFR